MNIILNFYFINLILILLNYIYINSLLKRCGIVEKYLIMILIGYNLKKLIYVKLNDILKIIYERYIVYSYFKFYYCVWLV